MATLPAFFKVGQASRPEATGGPTKVNAPAGHTERSPFLLRALPHEDVFFYCKKIDNSRLVREPDPQARGRCWSAVAVACVALALLTGVLAPSVANTLAGYRLEKLRDEERHLLDERRALELKEAELLSPQKLEQLAKDRNLVIPSPGQVVHLEPKSDGSMAMRGSRTAAQGPGL